MKKVFLVQCDNGEEYENYEEFTYKYCFSTKEEAEAAIKKLQEDRYALAEMQNLLYVLDDVDDINEVNSLYDTEPLISDMHFWIKEIELIEQ